MAGPLQQAGRLHYENDLLERELRRTQIQDQALQKQIEAMGTDQGIIVAARQKGFMLPTERPLHIQKEVPIRPSTGESSSPQSATN